MYQNFRKKFAGMELKELFWKAASTANKLEFERCMKKIEKANPPCDGKENAVEWLRNIPAEQWARSHFPFNSRCDILVNNLCESFNNCIIDARDKPIITMLEMIRSRLLSRMQVKKQGMEKYEGNICPNILKKISKLFNASKAWCANWVGNEEYEVDQDTNKQVVNLDTKTCTCGMFKLNGIPCCHALACIQKYGKDVEAYVDHCYSKEVYMRVHEHMIHTVPGPFDYVDSGGEALKPPLVPKRIGRPPKARRKDDEEKKKMAASEKISTRKGLTITCQKCLQQGHNKKYCRNEFHPNSKLLKAMNNQTQFSMEHLDLNMEYSQASFNPTITEESHLANQLPPMPRAVGRGRGVRRTVAGRGSVAG